MDECIEQAVFSIHKTNMKICKITSAFCYVYGNVNHCKLSWHTAGEAATKDHCQNQIGFQRERNFGFWVVKDGGERRKLFLKGKVNIGACLSSRYIHHDNCPGAPPGKSS